MVDSVEKVVFYALGAGGRRFESFCPDLKIKELQNHVTPFFIEKLEICTQFALILSFQPKNKLLLDILPSNRAETDEMG